MTNFYLSVSRYLTALLLLISTVSWSQSKTVTGKVTASEDGSPLPGVNIVEKGTSNGTISGVDGSFSISVTDNAVLVLSFVGYKATEVSVTGKSSIAVSMESDVTALSEVVVVGYGQQEKRDVTGAMGSINTESFNKGVIATPDQLFQGKLAGVQVVSSSGEPGSGVNITVRGASSIRANNNPLIVLDGFPLDGRSTTSASIDDAGLGSGSPKNPLNFLNPNDIQSIDVLKDASATAIYGSRGANGVILITTKKGSKGKGSVTYNGFFGSAKLSDNRKYDLLTSADYVQKAVAAGATQSAVDFGGSTNWQDEIFRTAPTQGHDISFGGGSDKTLFRTSMSYLNQQGIVKNSGMERYTMRINGTHKFIEDKLSLDFQMTYSKTNNSNAPISNNAGYQGSLIGAALQANPTIPIYKADGTFVQRTDVVNGATISNDFRNPMAMLAYISDKENTSKFLGNAGLTWQISKDLQFRTTIGADNSESVRRVFYDKRLKLGGNFDSYNGRATLYNRYLSSYITESYLTYKKHVGSGDLTLLGGFSYQQFSNEGHYFAVHNLPTGDNFLGYNNVDGGKSPNPGDNPFGSDKEINTLRSLYGRANYAFGNDKYLLTATVRADGSSRFGSNNSTGIFPSFALGWRLSDEEFIPEAFQDLKLRAGWGITGNQEIPNGISKARYQIDNTTGALTLLSTPNPNIKWEEARQWNIGVDFGVLNGRLSGSIDYFNKSTTDLIIQINTPQPAPTRFAWQNLDASVLNQGVELAIDGLIIDKSDIQWRASSNLTYYALNEVRNLNTFYNTGNVDGQGLSGAYAQRIANGYPLGVFYMQEFTGIDEQGRQTFANNGALSYGKSPQPKALYGLTNNFSYKRFDLAFTFNGQTGNYIYNNTANALFLKGSLGNGRNVTREVADNKENSTEAPIVSTRYLEKGAFIRLNNVTLGYNVNVSDIKWMSNLRVYVTGQNLLLITKYNGFDPEINVNKSRDGVPSIGIDYTGFPRPRTITAGVSVSF